MARKVKRGCNRRSRRGRGRKSLEVQSRKRCGSSRKRRQSRNRMRGGSNKKALQEVLDAALNATSGGALGGTRLNGGQRGGSRRRTKRSRRARRSMRGGVKDVAGNEINDTREGYGNPASSSSNMNQVTAELTKSDFTFGGIKAPDGGDEEE